MSVPRLAIALAILASGCVGVEGDEVVATQTPEPAASEEIVVTPIDLSGTTRTVACARVQPIVHCRVVLEGSPIVDPLVFPGWPVALRATLQWGSSTPFTEELATGVVAKEDGEWGRLVECAYAVGPSPLEFDFDLTMAPTPELGLHTIYYTNVADGVVHFSLRQDWTLTGEIVSIVSSA